MFLLLGGRLVLATPAAAQASAPGDPGTPSTTAPPAAPPTAANPGVNTWSVSPTGTDPNAPSERTNFSYELAPGATADDSATVWNYSDTPRVFDVYVRDAFATKTGGIDLLTKDKQNADLGGWVALSTSQVTVPARSGATVPFSVTAPRTATPGDHDAGMIVSLATVGDDPTGTRKVVIDHRIALRIYLRVTGPLQPLLVIDSIDASYQGTGNPIGKGDLAVTYTVRNAGNVRLKGHQALDIKGVFGWSLAERLPEDLPELLPGASVTRTEHFTGIAPAVRLTPTVTVTPFVPAVKGTDVSGLEPAVASTSVWAIPWSLLLLVVVLVVGSRVWRRWRPRRAPASGEGGTGPGAGRVAPTGGPADAVSGSPETADGVRSEDGSEVSVEPHDTPRVPASS